LREDLRLLEAKVRVGLLGKSDSRQARVVAILACRCSNVATHRGRNSEHNRDPRQALAKAVGLSKNVFDHLCSMVDNDLRLYQHAVSNENALNCKNRASLRLRKPLNPSDDAKTSTTLLGDQSLQPENSTKSTIIPELAIRLGNWIPDSEGIARSAQQLMDVIEHFISASVSAHLRAGYSYAIQRHRSAYEAACFFLKAKQDGATTATKIARRSTTVRASSLEDDEDDDMEGEGDAGRPLELNHVLDALSNCSGTGYIDLKILRGAVGFLTKIMLQMKEVSLKSEAKVNVDENQGMLNKSNRKRKRNSSETCKKIKEAVTKNVASIPRKVNSILDCANRGDRSASTMDVTADELQDLTLKDYHDLGDARDLNAVFLEWKGKVLADARRKTKERLEKDDLTDSVLSMQAANDVLRRRGLLHLFSSKSCKSAL
jgi:hypothetical protein